jgi:AraC-like DNA-binding protein
MRAGAQVWHPRAVASFAQLERRLRALPEAPGARVALRSCCIAGVAVDTPVLLLVLEGEKRLDVSGVSVHGRRGEFVMLHRPERVDMTTAPGRHRCAYRAWAIPFPWRLVELARSLVGVQPAGRAEPPASVGPVALLAGSLAALLDAAEADAPPALLDHALLGLLVALASAGHGQFLRAADPSLAAQVRLLVGAAPTRPWRSAHVEALLHVSGATLRRRLAEEGTSLRDLIREARLHHGLGLLQSTRKPLKAVARESGYRSVASFARGFQARFGVAASAVGG